MCLEISDLCGNHTIELLNVFSRPSLPVTVDEIQRQMDVDRWAYLKSIHVPHIDAEIELLIGNDAGIEHQMLSFLFILLSIFLPSFTLIFRKF